MKKDLISVIGISALGVNINDLITKLGQVNINEEYLLYRDLGLFRTKTRIKYLKH